MIQKFLISIFLMTTLTTSVFGATFIKNGNNGTTSCNNFCAGPQFGQVGTCAWAENRHTMVPTTCDASPGLIPGGDELMCGCDDGTPEQNRIPAAWKDSTVNNRCDNVAVGPGACATAQAAAVTACGLDSAEQQFDLWNSVVPFCAGGQVIAVCSCGCFDAGTQIAVEANGEPAWAAVETITMTQAVSTLEGTVSLSDLVYQFMGLNNVIKGPESQPVYVFQMANGRELVLSQNHGVLLTNGTMARARDLELGSTLVDAEGKQVAVLAISRRPAKDGNVYNVLTNSKTNAGHLILANGFVVGDVIWQNSFEDEIGSVILRQ